jgi:multidrug efflux system membrane fusion protein
VLAAEAAHNSAKLDLEFTEIRAPISGKISRPLVTPGNYVSGVAGFTTLLTTIVTIDPVHVYSDLDESTLLKLNDLIASQKNEGPKKIPVEMRLGDGDSTAYEGVVESFDNRVDANTGSILLRTEFANPEGRIIPGLFARIRIPVTREYTALLVDETAVGTDQNQKFVLTLSPTNTVEYRSVKLGPVHQGKRVVRSGLQAGDKVVVNGLKRVRPGSPVSPQLSSKPNSNSVAAVKATAQY